MKAKDKKRAIELITELCQRKKDIDKDYENINKLFGIIPESPFFQTSYLTFDFALRIIVEMVRDKNEWIDWYIYENKCGEKELEAGKKGKMKKIKTVKQLVDLI